MSNIRDLQKLKHNRFNAPLTHLPPRVINPEISQFNCEPLSLQIGHHKVNKNTHYGKETMRPTPSKVIHKRGASFGTPDASERHTFNLIQNPRLSMYLYSHSVITSP